jgi:hypothetical protein
MPRTRDRDGEGAHGGVPSRGRTGLPAARVGSADRMTRYLRALALPAWPRSVPGARGSLPVAGAEALARAGARVWGDLGARLHLCRPQVAAGQAVKPCPTGSSADVWAGVLAKPMERGVFRQFGIVVHCALAWPAGVEHVLLVTRAGCAPDGIMVSAVRSLGRLSPASGAERLADWHQTGQVLEVCD